MTSRMIAVTVTVRAMVRETDPRAAELLAQEEVEGGLRLRAKRAARRGVSLVVIRVAALSEQHDVLVREQ